MDSESHSLKAKSSNDKENTQNAEIYDTAFVSTEITFKEVDAFRELSLVSASLLLLVG
jgi:hypothetical protein